MLGGWRAGRDPADLVITGRRPSGSEPDDVIRGPVASGRLRFRRRLEVGNLPDLGRLARNIWDQGNVSNRNFAPRRGWKAIEAIKLWRGLSKSLGRAGQ